MHFAFSDPHFQYLTLELWNRRDNQLCARIPIRVHLHRLDLQETASDWRDLQPFPRPTGLCPAAIILHRATYDRGIVHRVERPWIFLISQLATPSEASAGTTKASPVHLSSSSRYVPQFQTPEPSSLMTCVYVHPQPWNGAQTGSSRLFAPSPTRS